MPSKVQLSTGLRNALATSYGLGLMMDGGVLYLYEDPKAPTPDDPPGQSPLGVVTTEGRVFVHNDDAQRAGLRVRFVAPGGLTHAGDWRLKGLRRGWATWFRWCWAGPEDFGRSAYFPRVDGPLGDVLALPNPLITEATDQLLDSFLIVVPGR